MTVGGRSGSDRDWETNGDRSRDGWSDGARAPVTVQMGSITLQKLVCRFEHCCFFMNELHIGSFNNDNIV